MVDSILGARYEDADAVVIGVPYHPGAPLGAGAQAGPRKIKEVLDWRLELFDRFSRNEPAHDHRFGYREVEHMATATPERMVAEMTNVLSAEARFFVLLGGVHSVTIPALNALRRRHDPSTVTVLQIDAHFDLRDDDSDYSDAPPGSVRPLHRDEAGA